MQRFISSFFCISIGETLDSEKVSKLTFRKTNLVIRCPHCRKTLRLVKALVEKEEEEE